jgi:hypothetical protein
MKTRYNESFLFPQGQNDFGRTLVFPQGTLRGLGSTTEQQNLTYGFMFPQGETDDYGRALMFPQGQLHGLGSLGDAVQDGLIAYYNNVKEKADLAQKRYQQLQNQLAQQSNLIEQQNLGSILSIDEGILFLQTRGLYQSGMTPETIAATVHAVDSRFYVRGAGTGYGSADALTPENARLKNSIDQAASEFNSYTAEMIAVKQQIDARTPDVIAAEQKKIADSLALRDRLATDYASAVAQTWDDERKADQVAMDKLPYDRQAVSDANNRWLARSAAKQEAIAAAARATISTQPAILNKTIVAVNNTAGTVTSTTPATGTVTTTSPTTGATTTANVITGAVTVTTGSGQTVSGTGSVTAGNTSTTVNQAAGTVTTTNTTTGATTVTNVATGQIQTGTAQPTSYILDFHDNQFWLTTSAGAPVRNGSADFKTPADFLSNSGITLSQTTLTAAASVKFANNHGVTTVVNSAGGTTTTNPTTGTVTSTNPATGTVTTTNTATGTTTTTTPATGTTTVTTGTATNTGKLALYALLGVLLLRGAVR